jgi:cyclic pyranopterin monophosphate synthase
MNLTHADETGRAHMVDVSEKPALQRHAVAQSHILLAPETRQLIQENGLKKGDVLAVARIAGIQAAKQTWLLIPLCHQLPLSQVRVDFSFTAEGILIRAEAKTQAATGVEMEALTAASVAALTLYDMCKAVDKTMRITDTQLLEKTKQA